MPLLVSLANKLYEQSRMKRRRNTEVFTLSFLDALCCGFGAIILLFILSVGAGQPGTDASITQEKIKDMRGELERIEASVAEKEQRLENALRTEETRKKAEQQQELVRKLEGRLAELRREYESRKNNLSAGRQTAAAARRLLRSFPREDPTPIGLPAKASHVAFVIDTSGSMRNQLTNRLHHAVTEQISELLDTLPEVERIQFFDTSGNYMLSGARNHWLPDTPGLRNQALRNIRNYPRLSASDPEPGIRKAIRDLLPALGSNDKMALYVLGDDFRGNSQSFLLKLDRLNPRDPESGERRVSINAVGFPTMNNPFQIGAPQGNVRYANIMREIAETHGGVLLLKSGI